MGEGAYFGVFIVLPGLLFWATGVVTAITLAVIKPRFSIVDWVLSLGLGLVSHVTMLILFASLLPTSGPYEDSSHWFASMGLIYLAPVMPAVIIRCFRRADKSHSPRTEPSAAPQDPPD